MIPTKRSLLLLLCCLAICCGPSQRQKAATTTWNVTKALEDGFYTWDLDHQQKILDTSPDRATFETRIAEYRAKREPVTAGFVLVYRLIGAVSINESTPLPDMLAALVKLKEAIEAVQSSISGSSPSESTP